MNKIDWKKVNKENMEHDETNGWKYYPSDYCNEEPPSIFEIRKHYQINENSLEWKQSTHPYCKSCYGLYSQTCEKVAQAFNIPSHPTTIDRWKNDDLTNKIEIIGKLSTEEYSPLKTLTILTPLLNSLIECIKTRHYYYGKCYFNNDASNPSLVKSDDLHMIQITKLCKNLLILYKTYKLTYEQYMYHHKANFEDFSIKEERVFNICRHQIKQFGSLEEKEIADDVFRTDTPLVHSKRSRSPNRSRNNKQSRVNTGYIISHEDIKQIN